MKPGEKWTKHILKDWQGNLIAINKLNYSDIWMYVSKIKKIAIKYKIPNIVSSYYLYIFS